MYAILLHKVLFLTRRNKYATFVRLPAEVFIVTSTLVLHALGEVHLQIPWELVRNHLVHPHSWWQKVFHHCFRKQLMRYENESMWTWQLYYQVTHPQENLPRSQSMAKLWLLLHRITSLRSARWHNTSTPGCKHAPLKQPHWYQQRMQLSQSQQIFWPTWIMSCNCKRIREINGCSTTRHSESGHQLRN